jgi:predicted nucleic acid-binding protein
VEALGSFRFPGEARTLLAAAEVDDGIELWAPDLVYTESASALRKFVLRGELPLADAAVGIDRIVRLPLTIAGAATLLRDAWTLRENLTMYDACYVALTRRLGGTFITADAALARAVRLSDENVVELYEL